SAMNTIPRYPDFESAYLDQLERVYKEPQSYQRPRGEPEPQEPTVESTPFLTPLCSRGGTACKGTQRVSPRFHSDSQSPRRAFLSCKTTIPQFKSGWHLQK